MMTKGKEKERRYVKREDGNKKKTRGCVYKRDRLGVAILIDLSEKKSFFTHQRNERMEKERKKKGFLGMIELCPHICITW